MESWGRWQSVRQGQVWRVLVGLKAWAFFFNLFGIGGEEHVVASIATEEATSWLAGGGVGRVSLLTCFKAIVIALGPLSNLFMVEESPQVFSTIFLVCEITEKKQEKEK